MNLSPQLTGLLPLIALFAVMYFLMIRPQQKQQKERRAMLEALKKGDRAITIGGIHGTVVDLDESVVTLRIAEKVEIKLNRSAIGAVLR